MNRDFIRIARLTALVSAVLAVLIFIVWWLYLGYLSVFGAPESWDPTDFIGWTFATWAGLGFLSSSLLMWVDFKEDAR